MNIPQDLKKKLEKYEGQVPMPIVSLAADFGIEVFSTGDLSDRESGLLKKEDGQYVIYINERHPAVRQRFTIAHEIAHFIKHKDYLEAEDEGHLDFISQPVNGEKVLQRAERPMSDSERAMEEDANSLAAEILMPEGRFRIEYEKANTIEEVANLFGVSSAAATIRAKNLLGQALF